MCARVIYVMLLLYPLCMFVQLALEMEFSNQSLATIQGLAIQQNKNYFGLAPINAQIALPAPVPPGASATHT